MKKPVTPFQIVGKGLKAIGRAAVAPIKWAGRQVEKEMRMNKAKDDRHRVEGEARNRDFSGLPSNVRIRK